MNDIEQTWVRLVSAARQAQTPGVTEIPPGFATCVIAKWKTTLNSPSVWEFLSVRALAFAFLLMVGSIAVNYNVINDNGINYLDMSYGSANDDWANSSVITNIIPEFIFAP
jgi:hypothetical protein